MIKLSFDLVLPVLEECEVGVCGPWMWAGSVMGIWPVDYEISLTLECFALQDVVKRRNFTLKLPSTVKKKGAMYVYLIYFFTVCLFYSKSVYILLRV